MTEKRYMRRYGSFSDGTLLDNVLNKQLSHLEVCSLVNEQSEDIIRLGNKIDHLLEENDELKQRIKGLESDVRYFEETYEIEERGLNCVPEMCTITSNTPSRKELFKYNEELEQRNTRQYTQLKELWELIKSKDWETLNSMERRW